MQPAKKTRVVTVTLYGRHAEWIERRIKDLEDQGLIEVHGKTIVVYGTR